MEQLVETTNSDLGSWGSKQEVERPYKFGGRLQHEQKRRAGRELAGAEELY